MHPGSRDSEIWMPRPTAKTPIISQSLYIYIPFMLSLGAQSNFFQSFGPGSNERCGPGPQEKTYDWFGEENVHA